MDIASSIKKALSGEFFYLKNKPKSILFDHLPKCAGTTINSYLKKFYPYRLTYHIKSNKKEDYVQNFLNLDSSKQKSYKFIYGHRANQLIPFTDENKIVVTVMREPVDRIVSHYYYVKRNSKHQFHQEIMGKDVSLEEYCSTNLGKELNNWYVYHFTGLTKAEINQNPESSAQAALKYIEKNYGLIGFQDQLPAFFSALQLKAGISSAGFNEQNSKNTTSNRPQSKVISDLARKNILNYNKADVLLFSLLFNRRKNGVVHL
ncbi:sulfotransferase family 2 domain-containing protein [Neolewinella agarilytica]|uniref:Sulfotransferase family protein n=1 Tax=Neolewinella agarilytica TaxID=478744 RepID=A0A1H9DXW1_9BACT|nr:sulfotransferase family 2 domain-containing protein [Neolewinella agarilytica]SEQ18305.1 Sulfotransferase family protein [Neolewinella agarilytica]